MNTKTDREAFLRMIRERPDDDTPRLVYADWLQEHTTSECSICEGTALICDAGGAGLMKAMPSAVVNTGMYIRYSEDRECNHCDGTGRIRNGFAERAEFIRVQCKIAEIQATCLCGSCVCLRGGGQHHNGPCAVGRERIELTDGRSQRVDFRERELLESLTFGGTPGEAYLRTERGSREHPSHFIAILRRGFIDEIVTDWEGWLSHYEWLRDSPDAATRRVELTTWPDWEWIHRRASDIGRNRGLSEAVEDLRAYLSEEYPGHCSYEENGQTQYHPIEWVLPGEAEG